VDLSTIETNKIGDLTVEVIDSVEDYVSMLKEIFDFPMIKSFLDSNPNFKVLFDGLHGGTPTPFLARI
jgi:phosphoglucomutase